MIVDRSLRTVRNRSSEAYIYYAVRTPRGKNRGGALHSVKPIDLVTGLIDALRERNPDLDDKAIDDMVLGVEIGVRSRRASMSPVRHRLA